MDEDRWEALKRLMWTYQDVPYAEIHHMTGISLTTLDDAFNEAFEEHRGENRKRYEEKYQYGTVPNSQRCQARITQMVGRQYGCWTLIGMGETRRYKYRGKTQPQRTLHCRCVCGKESDLLPYVLESGNSIQCYWFSRPRRRRSNPRHEYNTAWRVHSSWRHSCHAGNSRSIWQALPPVYLSPP